MTLPSHEFVIAEVDREFAREHPEARRRLDEHDPRQAHLVDAWNEMFHPVPEQHRRQPLPQVQLGPEPKTPDPTNSTPTSAGGGQTSDPGPQPAVGVHMDESAFREWVRLSLEGAHYVGDTAEVLGYFAAGAGQESALVILGEALGPVGMVAAGITALWATAHAFGTGRRLQEQEGFCYGIMWQVFGLPNGHKGFTDWSDDSADELGESFHDGVASGREKGAAVAVHNRVVLATAYYQKVGNDEVTAQSMVLHDMWRKIEWMGHATTSDGPIQSRWASDRVTRWWRRYRACCPYGHDQARPATGPATRSPMWRWRYRDCRNPRPEDRRFAARRR